MRDSKLHRAVEAQRILQDKRPAFAFAWRFCLIIAVGIGSYYLLPVHILLDPFIAGLATLVGGFLKLVGLPVDIIGHKVVLPGIFGIEIAAECTGGAPLYLFISGVLAYPTSNASRLFGVIMATIAILMGNFIRLTTLFWVGVRANEYFDLAHTYFWNLLSYIGLVIIWLLWLHLSALPHSPSRITSQLTA